MKCGLDETCQNARLATEKDESNSADEWRQDEWQCSEGCKQSPRRKRVALKKKRERNADRGAEENCQDGDGDTREDRLKHDRLRECLHIVGCSPNPVLLKRGKDDVNVWIDDAVEKDNGDDERQKKTREHGERETRSKRFRAIPRISASPRRRVRAIIHS